MRGLNCFLARLCKDLNWITDREELHGRVAIVFQLGEFLVNVDVVDFSAPGLVPAGNVSDMHQSNLIEVPFEIGNQVAAGNLGVEEIVEDFDLGMIHFLNDLEGLGD